VSTFIDSVRIILCSGNGGDGAVSFRRKRYYISGPPDGGNGGSGGHVEIYVDESKESLSHLITKRKLSAQNGENGLRGGKDGRNGMSLLLPVPLGTVIRDAQTGSCVCKFLNKDDRKRLLKGGRGGKGNIHFKSSRNRSPRFSQSGMEGECWELIFDYFLQADIALVGLSNSGKSTLLRFLTTAHPAITDYPYSTDYPARGHLVHEWHSFSVVEFPAFSMKGTGFAFFQKYQNHLNGISCIYYVCDVTKIEFSLQTLQYLLVNWREKVCGIIVMALQRNIRSTPNIPSSDKMPVFWIRNEKDVSVILGQITQQMMTCLQKV